MRNALLSVHMYPPHHMAGGEIYMHNLGKMLLKMGYNVRVYMHRYWGSPETASPYDYDGIEVFPPLSDRVKDELFDWADITFCHLDFSQYTIFKSGQLKKPCVFVVHNTSHYYDNMINHNTNTFVLYNAEHAKAELQYKRPSMVLEPPLDLSRCVSEDKGREYITLINLCENKGVRQFYEMAKLMPDRKFLGITGSYMDQEPTDLPNVTIWPKQTDIRKVYEVTRILVHPSDYESYSMVASEALANGIPVICSPTPGLKENCGDGAQYLDRNDIKKWVSLLRKLDTAKEYDKWSRAGLNRTATREDKFKALELFLNECKL